MSAGDKTASFVLNLTITQITSNTHTSMPISPLQYSRPFVSVIIPNYNHALYLRERINSVLNQTYDAFEVILLDDASTDTSLEVIDDYRHHEKVTQVIINQENTGNTFKQWQRGLSLARGEYIWIAESDDVASPTFLEEVLEKMLIHDAVLGFSGSQIIDSNGHRVNKNYDNFGLFNYKDCYDGKAFARRFLVFGNRLYNASMIVFRKAEAEQVSEHFTQFNAAGDWLFWFELCQKGKVVCVRKKLNQSRLSAH